MQSNTTIFALASAAGRAGVAVFRASGTGARDVIARLCRPNTLPSPRVAVLRKIHHPVTGELIDHALVILFKAPHSFTGEDVVEIHAHGGRAIMAALTECLRALPDFCLAEPGEFTRRAFENGKLDLTEAEAIADLVDAETETQRRQALRQFEGALGKLYEDWRMRLAHVLAYLEAAIDFADEDLPQDVTDQQTATIRDLTEQITRHLNDGHRGERLRTGFSIAILGPPNAGKSSLLNALAQRDAAIVSSIAGTTRDVIEVHLDLGGYPVTLADTAGLRKSVDAIENEGIRRALQRAERADLKLIVFDGAVWPRRDATTEALVDKDSVVVVSKGDLLTSNPQPLTSISVATKAGIPQLIQRLTQEIEARFGATEAPPLTRARHRAALEECAEHLQRSLHVAQAELRAEDVRLAMRALGRITGRVDVEDLLDIIFRDFCVGK
jgi:tRNA modification GTPase